MSDWSETSRRRFLIVSTAGIATVAGCTGGGADSSSTTTKQSTTATAATTTTTESGPTLDSVSFPEGVSKSSVTGDLLLAHQLKTSGESYTIERQYANQHTSRKTKIQLGTSKAAQKQVANGMSRSFWKTGDVGLCKANGGAYYYHCDPTVDRKRIGDFPRISRQLNLGDYSPTSVEEQNGTTLITAKATSATLSGDLARVYSNVNSYKGTIKFSPDGVIHTLEYQLNADVSHRNETHKIKYSWTASKFGETTVTRPSWVAQATEKAFDFEVAGHPDEDYIAIDVTDGNGTLPSNLFVSLNSPQGNYTANPDIALSTGDTLYIAPQSNSKLGVTTGKPPNDRASASGNYHLRVTVNGPPVIEQSVSL